MAMIWTWIRILDLGLVEVNEKEGKKRVEKV